MINLKGSAGLSESGYQSSEPFTYARIDCKGFKELSIAADVVFSRDILIPVDGEGKEQGTGNYN